MCSVSCKKNETANVLDVNDNNSPFDIDVLDVKLIQATDVELSNNSEYNDNKTNNSNENLRLNLTVSINNKTNLVLDNVQYKIRLNESAKPFIASGIIERISDNFFRIVPQNSKEPQYEQPVNGLISVTGFKDTWSPLITTDEDLEEFTDYKPNDIYENINTVTVTWDGGSQQESIRINLKP